MTEQINGLADLRQGDIMFGPIGGIVPGLFPVGVGQFLLGEVFRSGRLSVRHVGVVVQAASFELRNGGARGPRLVQAMPGGAEEIELSADHWTDRYVYVRPPEDYPGQAAAAAKIARLFVREEVPYSFASYAALAAWRVGLRAERLARWVDRRGHDNLPMEAICSVLADQAWTLAGKDLVQGTRSQIVTPGMLATQLIHRTPGVVIGWGGTMP